MGHLHAFINGVLSCLFALLAIDFFALSLLGEVTQHISNSTTSTTNYQTDLVLCTAITSNTVQIEKQTDDVHLSLVTTPVSD